MRIAVNTRFLIRSRLEGIGWFTFETMRRIVTARPEHEFVFLFDRPYDPMFIFGGNVRPRVVWPPARHPYLWHIWFQYRLPGVLRDMKPDLFISTDGFMPLRMPCPALLVIHDLAFEHFPEHVPPLVRNYYRKYSPLFAKAADRIATVSEFSKGDICERYGIGPDKVDVVYNGVSEVYRPLGPEEQAAVRRRFAGGSEYFLFVSALQPRKNVVRLMQGFDAFKNKTGSAMKLLIAGSHTWIRKEIEAVHRELSHNRDVIFLGHVGQDDLGQLMGSAMALCYVSMFEGFGIPILEAMHAGIPVVTSNRSSMPEVAGDAALLVDPFSAGDIAMGLETIFTQPALRQELVARGFERRAMFSWDQTAGKLWNAVERIIDKR